MLIAVAVTRRMGNWVGLGWAGMGEKTRSVTVAVNGSCQSGLDGATSRPI